MNIKKIYIQNKYILLKQDYKNYKLLHNIPPLSILTLPSGMELVQKINNAFP